MKIKITMLVLQFMLSMISVNAQISAPKNNTVKNIKKLTKPNYNLKLLSNKIASDNITAAFRGPSGAVYFFTDTKYSRYNITPDNLQKVALIKGNWSKVPNTIDATLLNKANSLSYFFKGSKYYRYNFRTGKVDKIAAIRGNWKGVPDNIDAAVQHPNGKFYFFKGDKYYRYSSSVHKVDKTALISKNWKGVPNNTDAVLLHKNGKIYFFKGKKYYRYNIKLKRVDKVGTIGVNGWKGQSFKLGSGSQLPSEKVRIKKNVLLPFANNKTNIKYIVKNGKTFFEDDIVLGTSSQVVRPRPKPHPERPDFKIKYDKNGYGRIVKALTAVNSDECLWNFGIIPYEFDSSDNWTSAEKKKIIKTLKRLNKETNLTLVPRNGDVDYLEIEKNSDFPKDGGYSAVGRTGGGQDVVLGSANQSMVAHEVLHAAGFYHEQSRPDRDKYVIINEDNIKFLKGHNFDKHLDARPIGPYDFKSIMHYSANAFSNNNKPTIEPKNPSKTIGERYTDSWLSDIDIDGINIMYPKDYKTLTSPPLKTLRKVEINIKKLEAKSGTDGCGEVEFYSKTEIGGGHTWRAGANGNNTIKKQSGTVEGRKILPNWKHIGVVNKNTQTAKIVIEIREEDGGFCFSDDWADVNPLNGAMKLQLLIKLTNGEIYIWDSKLNKRADYVGQVGQDIPLQGFEIIDGHNDETIPMHIVFKVEVTKK